MTRRPKAKWEFGGIPVRSKLEQRIGNELIERGVKFSYESKSFVWREKISRAACDKCGSKEVFINRRYTPDFFLDNGLIIEVKGNFTSKDRKIAAAMKEQYPELDIALLFAQDNWLSRGHKNRYSDWCASRKIKCAVGQLPEEWLQ